MALATSPPVDMPPSAITCTYTPVSSRWRMRAPAASAMAVAWGTPMPRTPRVEHALGIVVSGPQTLEIQDGHTTELPDLDRRGRADDAVHGGRHQRQVEAVGVDLPGDVDVLGVARAPAGDDGDVVEAVRPPTRFADPDLDPSHLHPFESARTHEPRTQDSGRAWLFERPFYGVSEWPWPAPGPPDDGT